MAEERIEGGDRNIKTSTKNILRLKGVFTENERG